MIRFILVTFLFLGWAFFELSGGSEFEPEEVVVAAADNIATPAAGIEIVTRSTDPTLTSLAVPTRLNEPLIAAPETAAPETAVVASPAAAEVSDAALEAVIEEVAADTTALQALTTDIREVAGSRVNMRTGPGTDYNVVTTLDGGTRAEVIDSDPSGWVKLRIVETGLEGWMAARLLTAVDG